MIGSPTARATVVLPRDSVQVAPGDWLAPSGQGAQVTMATVTTGEVAVNLDISQDRVAQGFPPGLAFPANDASVVTCPRNTGRIVAHAL